MGSAWSGKSTKSKTKFYIVTQLHAITDQDSYVPFSYFGASKILIRSLNHGETDLKRSIRFRTIAAGTCRAVTHFQISRSEESLEIGEIRYVELRIL